MEAKDPYRTVRELIESGKIKTFEEIFLHMAYSRLARDMGMNIGRMKKLRDEAIRKWILEDIYHMAKLFKVDDLTMLMLIHNQYEQQKKKRAKK